MNIDVYKIISSTGLKITSPAVAKADSAAGILTQADNLLSNPVLDGLGISTDTLSATRNAISAASSGLTGSVTTMAASAQNALSNSALAQHASRLDAAIDGIPPGCGNLTELFGSLMGEIDDVLDSIFSAAKDFIKSIADVISGILSTSAFEGVLDSLKNSISDAVSAVGDFIDKEKAKLEEIVNKIKSSALAQQISALWNHPCTQGLMNEVLPNDIKSLLK